MKNWKTWLAVLGVFVLGALVGSLLTLRVVMRLRPENPFFARMVERRLARQLQLDDQQKVVVHEAIEQARRDMLALRDRVAPEIRQVLDRAQQSIRASLRPEQQKKFDEMVRRRDRFLERQQVLPPQRRAPATPQPTTPPQ